MHHPVLAATVAALIGLQAVAIGDSAIAPKDVYSFPMKRMLSNEETYIRKHQVEALTAMVQVNGALESCSLPLPITRGALYDLAFEMHVDSNFDKVWHDAAKLGAAAGCNHMVLIQVYVRANNDLRELEAAWKDAHAGNPL